MFEKKSILIIGDHDVIIWALKIIIEETFSDVTVYSSATFTNVISLLRENEISLVILETDIASDSTFEMISIIQGICSTTRILIYSEIDTNHALKCLIAGVDGIISKESPFEKTILKALTHILLGKKYISPAIKQYLVGYYLEGTPNNSRLKTELTAGEQKIVIMLLRGKTTNEIANQFSIKAATVSTHKARIFKKLNVKSIVELYIKMQKNMPELTAGLNAQAG